MRLAVISDIHANFPALLAVVEDLKRVAPDEIIVAGDFINRGPMPRETLSFLRDAGWPLLRGNHEDYVIAQLQPHEEQDARANPIWKPAQWTASQIRQSDGHGDALQTLPLTTTRENGDILIVHGTPQKNSDGIFEKTTDDELREMLGQHPPRVLLCAHTHAALVRTVADTLIMNVGATGLPFNGDPRAQYGVLTQHNGVYEAELRQVEYSREETYRAFETGGFLRDGGPLARVIMQEVRDARPHLGPWVNAFAEQVRGGELSVGEATKRYFASL